MFKVKMFLPIALIALMASVASAKDLTIYDDFNDNPSIDSAKWFGTQSTHAAATLENYRIINDGQLFLGVVGYGRENGNTGRRTGGFGVGMRNKKLVSAIQADFELLRGAAPNCAGNTAVAQARAQLAGTFLNDKNSEYLAILEKVVDGKEGNFIRAILVRCESKRCGKGETLKALIFDHTWEESESFTLNITWDPSNSQFLYMVKPEGGQSSETRRISYDKDIVPVHGLKHQKQRIRVKTHSANCAKPIGGTFLHLAVDNVMLGYLDEEARIEMIPVAETFPVNVFRPSGVKTTIPEYIKGVVHE